MNPYQNEGYRKPTFPYIARFDKTEKLYKAEERLHKALEQTANALKDLYKEKNQYQHYWKEALPEVLAQLFETHDHKAAELAAIAYLEMKGYTITKEETYEV